MDSALDTYYARMSSSLGDKARLLDHITGASVLDVGCGSGDLLNVMLAEGFDAYGIDPAHESVLRIRDRSRARVGYANEIAKVFPGQQFDTIVCSSVFHEVFSYGTRYDKPGQISSLTHAVKAVNRALKPGGRLIVRDGVAPSDTETRRSMWVDDPEAVYAFLEASPFAQYNAWHQPGTDRTIRLIATDDPHRFEGSASSLMEFAFTYVWGQGSFEREVREFYGIFDLDEYARFVVETSDLDLRLTSSESYTQPGYVTHLDGKVKFDFDFPHTNAVWIYDKA